MSARSVQLLADMGPPSQAALRPSVRSLTTAMDTVVTVEVVTEQPAEQARTAIERALAWFGEVERVCSRFDPDSELRRLMARPGEPVPASPILFEAVRFALALARLTGGAFDPTIGRVLEAHGFNRNYRTGERTGAPASPNSAPRAVSYRDVRLDAARHTIVLRRPLVLDLGAVAKGLAIDLAARELSAFDNVCIDAGGDLFARGQNRSGQPWRIGVQSPSDGDALVSTIEVSDAAVCTSGNYERLSDDGLEHHLIDPRSGRSARALASVTVIAPTALAADGLATAVFIVGPDRGLRLLEREGVHGVLVTPAGEVRTTRQFRDSLR
jgi:thiamine biosynthesis lipoprotein